MTTTVEIAKPTDAAKSNEKSAELLPPAAALLRELLESSRNLPNSSTELGSIQLGLNEIKNRAVTLRGKTKDENDTKAHYLLAGSGVNAEDIAMELQSITFQQNLEPSTYAPSSGELNLDNYLRAKKEENILASIEESVRSTAREFDNFLAQNVTLDWKQRKQEICQHFGLISRPSGVDEADGQVITAARSSARAWGKHTLGRTVLGPVSGDGEFTDVDFLQPHTGQGLVSNNGPAAVVGSAPSSSLAFQTRSKKHAAVVTALNRARKDKKPFAIAKGFAGASQGYGSDTRAQQLHDGWKILTHISGEGAHNVPVTERKYAQVYNSTATDGESTRKKMELRKKIVHGARNYLQDQFYSLIESEIARYPQDAQLGGVPSVFNKIRAFLNLKFAKAGQWVKPNLEIVNNVPVWALLYYMIRSGHMNEALEYILQVEKSFQKVERSFPAYLKAFVMSKDNQLPRELLERLHTEFNQHIRFYDEASDPYKYALYKIIGRCELSRKAFPEVVTTAEDWLWVHLMLTRESLDFGPLHERYSLVDLQKMIIQFGAKHFNPNRKNPGLYFQVLLLSGLFEYAVHYLYSFSQIDAVHFAIALSYYGLLRPVSDVEKADAELLILGSDDVPYLNFARLVGYYTKDFRRSDPSDSVDYLVLICLNGDLPETGKKHLKMCHEALKELVLETREFSTLLGDVRADGTRQPGAIEQRMSLIYLANEKEYLRAITEQAAIKADEDGRTADAILLYQLSEEYDTVISIINKSLGEALSVVELGRPMSVLPEGVSLMLSATEDPAQLARNVMQVYSANPAILVKVSQRNRETCTTLLQIVNARDAFAKGMWDECIKETEATGVLSISPTADISTVKRKAQQFVSLHESIARNVPSMLVMVMQCCVNVSQSLNESEYSNAGRANKIAELRLRAKNCMVYAGMIQYRMSRDVYSQLTNLEISI
ncbi:nucleoporin Nic96p [Trichomonascus vanleenenianus]|uniref:linker nucleoporin NIC96 n=1 Tax=Trichomonascus vanleenenianus TaxID=2268995 RepID=UPI003ECA802A